MTNKTSDSTGYSWQNYDRVGNKIQDNSKTYDGEHTWYDVRTGATGWYGSNVTAEEKRSAGQYFRENRGKK